MKEERTENSKYSFGQANFGVLTLVLFCLLMFSTNQRAYAAEITQQEASSITVKGHVVDDLGEPIAGATVVPRGEHSGTITDVDGNFTIKVKSKQTVLIISFLGFNNKEVKAGDNLAKIVLEEATQTIDEVIVTGYQTIDRRLFAGAASIIKAEEGTIDGVADISRMLQGRAAGVQVQNVSGTFGASPKIRVRGASSIHGDSKPLWVVDGVILEDVIEVSADDLSSGNAATLISSAVAGLNADDIESFQILKDASATALYGARAMNGVVVITTKKGMKGDARVNYSGEFTVRLKPRYSEYNIMNSQEQMMVYQDMEAKGWLSHADLIRQSSGGIYKKMYDEIDRYDATSGSFGLANTPEARARYLQRAELNNTDWFDLLFKNSLQQNHAVSLSGGGERARYYASMSYFHDPGWSISDKVDRITANFNSSIDISKKVSLNLLTTNSLRKQTVPGTLNRTTNMVDGEYSRDFDINPFSYALNTSRALLAHSEDGGPEFYTMNYAPFSILHESANNMLDIDMLDTKFQAELHIKPIQGLDIRAIGSLRYVKSTNEHKIYGTSNLAEAYRSAANAYIQENNDFLWKDPDNPAALPEVVLPKGGFYNREDHKLSTYYFRATVAYNNVFADKHSVTSMFGQEIKSSDRSKSFSNGYGYQWDRGGIPFVDYRILRKIIDGGFDYYGLGRTYDRYVASFLNLGYSYNDRYVVNMTGRYDGSNRMGRSRQARWLPTWNVSAAWHLHNEQFMQSQDVISNLSLRATYGLTATMGPATNALAVYRNEVTFRPTVGDKESMIFLESLENSELTWEKQYEFNFGFDLGLFNNRISLSLDTYKRRGFDLIDLIRTSGIGGEAYKLANHADMTSKGVEFSLNTRNIQLKDFEWSTSLTFSYNKNEVTNMKSNPNVMQLVREEGYAMEGKPVRGLYSIPFAGLTNEGLPQFTWIGGEIISNDVNFQETNDVSFLKYEGSIDPKIVGGMENSFRYKNFGLSVYLTYQFGNVIRLDPAFSAVYDDLQAMPLELRDRWMERGDEHITNIPGIPSRRVYNTYKQLNSTYNAYNYSDQRVAKGDFIRLKEITLSYNFPKKWVTPLSLKDLQLRFVASNLALLYRDKKLNGQDPEFFRTGGVAMPLPRQFTFTLKVGF